MKQRKASRQENQKVQESRMIRSRVNHAEAYLLEEYLGIAVAKTSPVQRKRK